MIPTEQEQKLLDMQDSLYAVQYFDIFFSQQWVVLSGFKQAILAVRRANISHHPIIRVVDQNTSKLIYKKSLHPREEYFLE